MRSFEQRAFEDSGIQAALANEIPLEQLRPLACLHVVRVYARELVDALIAPTRAAWERVVSTVGSALDQPSRANVIRQAPGRGSRSNLGRSAL